MNLFTVATPPVYFLGGLVAAITSFVNLEALERAFLEFVVVGKIPFFEVYYGFELIAVIVVLVIWIFSLKALYKLATQAKLLESLGSGVISFLPINERLSIIKQSLVLKWNNRFSPQA